MRTPLDKNSQLDKLCTLLHFVAVSADPPIGPGERSLGVGDARDTHMLGGCVIDRRSFSSTGYGISLHLSIV